MAAPNDFNSKIIAEFRANGGAVGGPFAGSDILLLHHTGARTGTERISPLAFQRIGRLVCANRKARLVCANRKAESFAVFASKAGAPENPAWYHNPLAHPDTSVEIGAETLGVRARVAEPAERDVIWGRQKQRAPHFARYEEKAAPRKIPVMVLDPVK